MNRVKATGTGAEPAPVIWTRPERPARGPRPSYSRAQITRAAVDIADAEGLEAASMRRIAAAIGAGAMSLYRYVPNRADLLELMADHVYGELDLPAEPSGDWRTDLALVAERTRTVWLAHPWFVGMHRPRPALGPAQLRHLEFTMGALDIGPPIDDILVYTGMVLGYAENAVRAEIGWTREARESGLTEERWMSVNGPYVMGLVESGEHPMLARVVMDARQPHLEPPHRFREGLQRVLDCVAAVLPDNVR